MNAPNATTRPLLGVFLVLLMCLCFATLDTSAKYLGQSMVILLILWARYMIQAVLMGLWLGVRTWLGPENLFRTQRPGFQLLRGLLLLLCSALLFYGLQHMPVAEFTAVSMLTPVLSTLLAVVWLKERVSTGRAAMVALALLGALIVVRPGSGLFEWAALYPLSMALTYAFFQLLTRQLAGKEHPLTTHFYTGVVGTVAMCAVLWFSPVDIVPTWQATPHTLQALLIVAGLAGSVGHLLLIVALGMAPVSVLMPFTYIQIALASVTGWLAFRHVPDFWAWIGMAVVAVSGAASIWLSMRENTVRRGVLPPKAVSLSD